MAIWDFFGSQAGQQGLMGFGSSMLANSGWKPVNSPGTTFGEILGQGMQAGMQGYQQGQAQHEREVELGYQKRQRAEQDRLARDQRLNDLAKQQEQIAARDLAIKQLGGRLDPAQASLLRAQDPAQAGASLLEYLSPQAVDPVKLGQGEALVDPRTGQMIASGLPEDRKPIQVGSTLLDPFTFQPLYQAPAEGMSQYQQAQLELERQKLAQAGQQDPTGLMQNLQAAGLQPGTPEYREAVMQALTKPQTQISMGDKAEQAGAIERAKSSAQLGSKRMEAALGTLDSGQSMMAALDRLDALNAAAPAGSYANVATQAEKLTGGLAPDLLTGGPDVAAAEEFSGLSAEMELQGANLLKGPASNLDAQIIKRTAPALDDSREGRAAKNAQRRAVTQLIMQRAQREAELLDAGMSPTQARKQVMQEIPSPGEQAAPAGSGGSLPTYRIQNGQLVPAG